MRADKECPFSGVTNSGRVWSKDAGSARPGVWYKHGPALYVIPWVYTFSV